MWQAFIKDLWENHRGKTIGSLAGLVFGVLVIWLGFWAALFITLCIALGYFIGKKVDEGKENLLDVLEKYLPPDHR